MNLKYYLESSMVVTKVNSAIQFKQKVICEDFIKKTTALRAAAKTKTERNLCEYYNLFQV